MGRKDKHKLGGTRNNPVFKVVGAKVSKAAKGRPKGVDIKLKKLNKEKLKEDVASLDARLVNLQHVAVQKKEEKPKPKPPIITITRMSEEVDVDSLAEDFAQKTAADKKND